MNGPLRILVAHPGRETALLAVDALNHAGFVVDRLGSADEVLSACRYGEYDLVIIDALFSGPGGLGLLRRVLDACPEVPVIVISGFRDVELEVRCLELGAVDYLVEPILAPELVARVRCHLRRSGGGRVLQAGRLRLDPYERSADPGDGPVPLSQREFELLRYLMDRAPHACSRQELQERVWGLSFDPGSNVVDVYVRRLRSKLGRGLIKTVRDVGYRLIPSRQSPSSVGRIAL